MITPTMFVHHPAQPSWPTISISCFHHGLQVLASPDLALYACCPNPKPLYLSPSLPSLMAELDVLIYSILFKELVDQPKCKYRTLKMH